MGIDIDKYNSKFAWAKTPQSLSEELMHLSTIIEDSYGYKIERKKNTSVLRITDMNTESSTQKSDDSRDTSPDKSNP